MSGATSVLLPSRASLSLLFLDDDVYILHVATDAVSEVGEPLFILVPDDPSADHLVLVRRVEDASLDAAFAGDLFAHLLLEADIAI